MSYNIHPTPEFKRQFKKLYKKYPSLKSDLKGLIRILKQSPKSGIHLGHNIYKHRLAIESKGKGKSGGARIITLLVTNDNEIYLTNIYDKGELENISKNQILDKLKKVGLR